MPRPRLCPGSTGLGTMEPLASGQTARMSVRGKVGEDPCPRHHANTWKAELTPGGRPRAQRVGICWHGIVWPARGPTTACHCGLPLTHRRVGLLLPRMALSMGTSNVPLAPCPPHTVGHPHWHRAAHGRTQTLSWTPASLPVALSTGWRPSAGHLWVWAHGPIHLLW